MRKLLYTLCAVALLSAKAQAQVEIAVGNDLMFDGKYATTFSCDQPIDFSRAQGIKAYTVKISLTGEWYDDSYETYALITEVKRVPANTGILILANEAKTYQLPTAQGEVAPLTNNDLVAATERLDAAHYLADDGYYLVEGLATLQDNELFTMNGYQKASTGIHQTGFNLLLPSIDDNGYYVEGEAFVEPGTAYLYLKDTDEKEYCSILPSGYFYDLCCYQLKYADEVGQNVVDAANIAEAKAMADGTEVRVMLNNAQVTYVSTKEFVIEDESCGILVESSYSQFQPGDILNGELIVGVKKDNVVPNFYEVTATDWTTAEVTHGELTAAEYNAQALYQPKNQWRLIRLEDATIGLTQDPENYSNVYSITAYGRNMNFIDLLGVRFDWMDDEIADGTKCDILGYAITIDQDYYTYVASYQKGNYFQPAAIVEKQQPEEPEDPTAISEVSADNASHTMYNLQGQRVNGQQRGIVVCDGKKMILK